MNTQYIIENGEPREAQRGDTPTHVLVPIVTLHRDTSADWCMVTEGDRTIDEGHVDAVCERLIERCVAIRDIRMGFGSADAPFGYRSHKDRVERPIATIPASEVFAIPEAD